jgi:outer membrane receptor protein involved in Fe transport
LNRTWLRLPNPIAALLVLFALVVLAAPAARAGTTGTIAGTVSDPEGGTVAAATVQIVGQTLGAFTDDDGRYTILNVPPGEYVLRISRIGYETVQVRDVAVSSDQITRIDVAAQSAAIESEEVVVTAQRSPVELKLTGSKVSVTRKEIEVLPIQDLEDVVELQAGVVDGHFRGGRVGEVQYQVDGVSVNDPYDNKSMVNIDRTLLQEVQVISGTFDAEYGQAMSGVVNAVLKTGTDRFEWSGEAFLGDFGFSEGADRLTTHSYDPRSIQGYQFGASGPLRIGKTSYLVSGRYFRFDDYLRAERRFAPTDSSNFEQRIFVPTGDGEEVPLSFSREWSGIVKLTNRSLQNSQISYQALVNYTEGQRGDWAYRLNPDGMPEQETISGAHGIDWTQTLSPTTFIEANLRQNYSEYQDLVYDDLFDPRYDEAGNPQGDFGYELGAIVQGVSFNRFRQKTNSIVTKLSATSQVTPEHQVKAGGEFTVSGVEFGTPGYLTYTTLNGEEQLVRHLNEPPDFPGVAEYRPILAGLFVQDVAEWQDLTIRAGLRMDHFNPRSRVPSDPANPANAIAGAPQSTSRATTAKTSVSPRLGVAYPIADFAAFHFAYGHFRQYPSIGEIFANADYQVLENLQAGGQSFGVLGNPDIDAESTIQYELGYRHAVNPFLGLDFTVFYKDIRDLIGVEFITTYNGAQYARLTNVDFGNVLGMTFTIDHRQLGPVNVALDYTWQKATGNASDPRETAVRAEAGEDPQPRLVALNWDQRHTFNLTVGMTTPTYNVSGVLKAVSGQPYTPVIESGFGQGLDTNSGRKPSAMVFDLRAERGVTLAGTRAGLFVRGLNLLDSRFFNGPVYESTGSPYYSRFPEADAVALTNPYRFLAPRRIEFGIRFGSQAPIPEDS